MTTGTMTNSGDWIQYYQHNISGEANVYGSRVSDSTVITTTTFPSTSVPSPRGLGSDHLSPADGRVSKPIRKRSRASRRTPTTLLSTDTNNFRAMVQRFTGGPNQTHTAGFQGFPNVSQFSFQNQHGNHATVAPIPNRYPLQFQQQQQQELRTNYVHQLHQQVENQTYVPAANAFLQRLDDSRTNNIDSNKL